MPFNDPHAATPRLWSYRVAEGLHFEASAADVALPRPARLGLESRLVWEYRREAGASPLCNFGRMHPRHTAPRNRSTGVRGRRLGDEEPGVGYGPSVPALVPGGRPGDPGWMGLAWSHPTPLAAAGGTAPLGPGVYLLLVADVGVMYIGQSTALDARLQGHARQARRAGATYAACLREGHTATQLLEVENNLIGAY